MIMIIEYDDDDDGISDAISFGPPSPSWTSVNQCDIFQIGNNAG